MADTSAHALDGIVMEILPPTRVTSPGSTVCDCCRQPRCETDFDEDGCGLCVTCLECDDVMVEV